MGLERFKSFTFSQVSLGLSRNEAMKDTQSQGFSPTLKYINIKNFKYIEK